MPPSFFTRRRARVWFNGFNDGKRIYFEAIEEGMTDEEVLRTEGVEISIVEEYKGPELVFEITETSPIGRDCG